MLLNSSKSNTSRTGAVILPMAWAADRYFSFSSWDRTVLPYPFSRVVVRFGKPITVQPGLDAEILEQKRVEIESVLNDIYQQAWQECNVERHDNGPGEVTAP